MVALVTGVQTCALPISAQHEPSCRRLHGPGRIGAPQTWRCRQANHAGDRLAQRGVGKFEVAVVHRCFRHVMTKVESRLWRCNIATDSALAPQRRDSNAIDACWTATDS